MITVLDVGFKSTGWAQLELTPDGGEDFLAAGVILRPDLTRKKQLRKADQLVEQSQHLYRELINICRPASGIIAEMPSAGARSATALRAMGMALALAAAAVEELQIPAEWVQPQDSKLALTGRKDASKELMQCTVLELYPGIESHIPRRGGKVVKDKWEHIADAVAAYHTARNGNMVRLLRIAGSNPAPSDNSLF